MGRYSSESSSRVYGSSSLQEMDQETHNDSSEETMFGDRNQTTTGFSKNDQKKNQESWSKSKLQRKKNQVFLEGYVETSDEDELVRTKSLTDEDLDELKGCFDLGFGFSYDEIPELCNTLPALELCYSMSQKFLDEQQKSPESCSSSPAPASTAASSETSSPSAGPIANWKISSPGDHPEDVKARLKFWAQAVACTVKLCNN